MRRLMAAQEFREQTGLSPTSLPILRRQAQLESLVVRGRKRGLCAVLGFQAITQIRALYRARSDRNDGCYAGNQADSSDW